MSYATLYLNDASITLFQDGKILYCQPSCVWIRNNEIEIGASALSKSRIMPQYIDTHYWSNLSTLKYSSDHNKHISSAEIVSRELEIIKSIKSDDIPLIIVIPPYLNNQQLSLFLGIANDLNIKILSFIESSVASTRREYLSAKLVHIDLHLHCLSLSLMHQTGKSSVDKTFIIDDCGQAAFDDCWIKLISQSFIKQCRFDPLYAAESDQKIINNLSFWVTKAMSQEIVHLEIEYSNQMYECDINSSDFIDVVMPLYNLLINKLRTIFHAEDLPAIQVTNLIAKLPGLANLMKLKLSAAIYENIEGCAVIGASERFSSNKQQDNSLKIIKSLPWDQSAISVDKTNTKISISDKPSHILFEDIAYPLGLMPIMIGSNPTQTENSLIITSNKTGISRDHCTLILKNDRCILNDLSRYGTYLNNQRIEGPSILNIGDKIRIGSPGIEITLITIGKTFGS